MSIFQRSLCGGAALDVRKRTLSAPAVRWMWQSHVGWLYCRPRAEVAIVVIVALGGLVALGGGGGARDTRSPKGGGCYRTITKNGNSVFIEITA